MKAGEAARPAARLGFEFRLLLTLVLTLVVVAAFQFLWTSRDIETRLLKEATFRGRQDVVFIQEAFNSGDDNAARLREMNNRLTAIDNRAGVRYVLLVDRFGVVVASSDQSSIGAYHGGPTLRDVVNSGDPRASIVTDNGNRTFKYIVPVDLPTGRFALEVEESASIIDDQSRALERSTLAIGALGMLVGVLLFFVFGGRSLSVMHRRALMQSSKDSLTNLENHRSFQEALTRTVSAPVHERSTVSLALIDVDDFKMVNDRLGHRQGDELLKKAATFLDTGKPGDRAFRIGGDEFALILPDSDSRSSWVICEQVWRKMSDHLDGVTVSIGIATFDEGCENADLYERADVALYEAKRRGRNAIVSYEELGEGAVVPAEKIRSVRRLLDEQVLGTAFQPIWDLEGQRPLGFEALARPTAEYQIQHAGELFSIAEMIGQSYRLDALAWKRALERAEGLPPDIHLFLNVSPFTADHGDAPIDALCEVVGGSNFEPGQIVVEFTEKWSGRRDLVIEQAERLRSLGFKLALDDVGAGSGDLEMMARLPVDFIKIDLHVVQKAASDRTARGVLHAIVAFAAHSNSIVIAEGIEDEITLNYVRNTVVDSGERTAIRGGQGYFLGKPAEGPLVIGPAPYRPVISS